MGDSVAEGTVLEWRVAAGDTVNVDDPLVEVSTDKVDAEVPSPVAGTIAELLVEPDSTVDVGTVLCRIAAGAGAAGNGPVQPAAETEEVKPGAEPKPTQGNGDDDATPVAARMAGAHGVDMSALRGTGPRGRMTKDDVQNAIEGNGTAAGARRPGRGRDEAHPRPRGHARPLHEREPLDPDGHQLPHRPGRPRSTRAAARSRTPAASSPSPT